jgi:hypothetical protein
MTDIFKCKICKTQIIAEESDSHVCKNIMDVKLDHDKLLLFDGEKWYPLNLKKFSKSFLLKILLVPIVHMSIYVPLFLHNQKTQVLNTIYLRDNQ